MNRKWQTYKQGLKRFSILENAQLCYKNVFIIHLIKVRDIHSTGCSSVPAARYREWKGTQHQMHA